MSVSEGDSQFHRNGVLGFVHMALFCMAMAWSAAPGAETADPNGMDASQGRTDATVGTRPGPVEIHTGFVIGDKGYIAPPYVVRSVDEVVYINDQAIYAWPWGRGYRGMPPGTGGSSRGDQERPSRDGQDSTPPARESDSSSRFQMRPPRGMPMGRQVARIEQHLRNEGMIICLDESPTAEVSLRQAIDVLDVLASQRSSELKVQDLMDMKVGWMSSEQWGAVVDTFKPTDELLLRLRKAREYCAEQDSRRVKDERRYLRLHSVITVFGFLLAVWAFGSLFACRSPVPEGLSSREFSGISPAQVIRLIVLVAILSVYDLVCTLFADGLGGLWELNPLAGSLLSSRVSIVVFKVVLTAGACTLLVYARHHRLAQLAAWWSGVLYTMLILRWATFNSVFMPG